MTLPRIGNIAITDAVGNSLSSAVRTDPSATEVVTIGPGGLDSLPLGSLETMLLIARPFAELPESPSFGTLAAVNDSSTTVWGAIVSGGGSNKVLALYGETAWTVFGKGV